MDKPGGITENPFHVIHKIFNSKTIIMNMENGFSIAPAYTPKQHNKELKFYLENKRPGSQKKHIF